MMPAMDRSVAWRSALLFAVALAVVAVVLALALPHSFFEDWGWLAGPAAWAACALVARRGAAAPALPVLVGRGARARCRASWRSRSGSTGPARRWRSSFSALWCGRLARPARARWRLMDLGLRERVALVTGGSKGIGAGIAAALARRGREGGDRRPHARDGRRGGGADRRCRLRVRLRRTSTRCRP